MSCTVKENIIKYILYCCCVTKYSVTKKPGHLDTFRVAVDLYPVKYKQTGFKIHNMLLLIKVLGLPLNRAI